MQTNKKTIEKVITLISNRIMRIELEQKVDEKPSNLHYLRKLKASLREMNLILSTINDSMNEQETLSHDQVISIITTALELDKVHVKEDISVDNEVINDDDLEGAANAEINNE